MENIEQENTQEVQQENNLLEGEVIAEQAQIEKRPQAIQLVLPKEAKDEIAELERQYRETIERENR